MTGNPVCGFVKRTLLSSVLNNFYFSWAPSGLAPICPCERPVRTAGVCPGSDGGNPAEEEEEEEKSPSLKSSF